jgi:integrase
LGLLDANRPDHFQLVDNQMSQSHHAKLTKETVDKIPLTETGQQQFYRDTELRGFGLRVGTKSKTYIVETKVNGKVCRYTIGKHGPWTPEKARKEAREKLVEMSKGQNPNDNKKALRAKGVTLLAAFDQFKQSRKSLKPSTLCGYERVVSLYLLDWQHKPLASITKDMVAQRHTKLSAPWKVKVDGQERQYGGSRAQANLAMRFLRALFNFAAAEFQTADGKPLLPTNPVKRLSETKAWNRVDRRRSVIKPGQLRAWFEAVRALKNDQTSEKREVVRDYLLLILSTGLRRQEAAKLTWDGVDFQAKTLTVMDTKNWQPLTLPMSDFVFDLLKQRSATNDIQQPVKDRSAQDKPCYVFPGDGVQGYIVEPRKPMARVTAHSGVAFTIHDLRRTFITIAESLDISAYAVKRLVNHSTGNDVTAGYVVMDVERLREPMQKITDYILRTVGIKRSAEVVELPARVVSAA